MQLLTRLWYNLFHIAVCMKEVRAYVDRTEAAKQAQPATPTGERDPLRGVRGEVAGLRRVVLGNIDSLLERGEKLDVLVDKSDRLTSQSRSFERSSRSLKQVQYLLPVKLMISSSSKP